MALRRCFSAKITEADPFKSLSVSAQALYLHLCMAADDDGFINNAVSISSQMDGGIMALDELTEKRFLLRYDGVYVVKHWRIANSLKNDRNKGLNYPEIAAKIWIKGNRSYTDHPIPEGKTLYEDREKKAPPAEWIPDGFQMDSERIPNGFLTEPNLTEPNRTEPNRTEAAYAAGVWGKIIAKYPSERVGNRRAAEEAYRAAVHSQADADEMLRNLEQWLHSEQWDKEGGRYIPILSNWIMRETWKTRPTKMAIPNASCEMGLAEIEAIWQTMGKSAEERKRLREAWLQDHPGYSESGVI